MDSDLFEKCRTKDRVAWDKFVKRYKGLVEKSIRYKLNKLGVCLDKQIVLDILQEVFLSIWEKDKLSELRSADCLQGWLAIISINMTSNYCRKNVFLSHDLLMPLEEELVSDSRDATLENVMPGDKCPTYDILRSKELRCFLEKEISRLGIKQQLVLKFSIYDAKKQKDIARLMDIPENTVSTLISRGKKHLRKKLEAYIEE